MVLRVSAIFSISDESGLVDEETLDRFGILRFLRDFLLNARRPSFMYIAPGLQLLSSLPPGPRRLWTGTETVNGITLFEKR